MRIAICFSGQLRTGVETSGNIFNFLGRLFPYCDFFIHTWDRNGQKNYCGTNICPPEEFVTEETIEKIKDIYKPKKMIVEDFGPIRHEQPWSSRIILDNAIPAQWYSFNKVIEYKREYEIEHNFRYDIVVKLRFDIIFPPERSLEENYKFIMNDFKNMIYVESPPPECQLNEDLVFINDVFYLGNSRNMDVFGNYYHYLSENGHKSKIFGYLLVKHLEKSNIRIYTGEHSGRMVYAIYRPESLKYSPLLEFQKCLECDAYYYYDVDVNYEYSGKYYLELLKKYESDDIFDRFKMVYTSDLKIKEGYEDSSLY